MGVMVPSLLANTPSNASSPTVQRHRRSCWFSPQRQRGELIKSLSGSIQKSSALLPAVERKMEFILFIYFLKRTFNMPKQEKHGCQLGKWRLHNRRKRENESLQSHTQPQNRCRHRDELIINSFKLIYLTGNCILYFQFLLLRSQDFGSFFLNFAFFDSKYIPNEC